MLILGDSMHKNAAEYDRQQGFDTEFASKSGLPQYPDGFIPEGRPCDWCGKPVEKGFIHDECRSDESNFWLDILY